MNSHASDRLKQQAEFAVRTAEQRARESYRLALPAAELDFSLRGRSAAQARMHPSGRLVVRINLPLLQAYPDDFLNVTIPHEVAHLVVYWQYRHMRRKPKPHGAEWQAVMRDGFGLEPQRCHSYATTPARVVPRNILYRCGCREHRLTRIMHNRIRKAGGAICKACRGPLQFRTILETPPSTVDS